MDYIFAGSNAVNCQSVSMTIMKNLDEILQVGYQKLGYTL